MIKVHVNAKQTPDSILESPVFPVFTEGVITEPFTQALQLKSKYNLR